MLAIIKGREWAFSALMQHEAVNVAVADKVRTSIGSKTSMPVSGLLVFSIISCFLLLGISLWCPCLRK